MTNRFTQLCAWADQSIALCKDLQALLARERSALIDLKGEDLAETTMSKEMVVAKILSLRRQIREAGSQWYGVKSSSDLETKLEGDDAVNWRGKHLQWQAEWKHTCNQVERNQRFLRHSQRNLGRLVEHWRRQLGESPLYSAKGKKVDAPSTGKVFEAKF